MDARLKISLSLMLVIFVWGNKVRAQGTNIFKINSEQALQIKKDIASYEKGEIDLKTIMHAGKEVRCRELIGYYLLNSNTISVKAKLPVSQSYAYLLMVSNAVPLAKDYVRVYSNEWHAWSLLGACSALTGATNDAIIAYGNAVRLGDKQSLEPFTGLALVSGRADLVKDLIPQLIEFKNSKEILPEDKLSLISQLLAYSVANDQEELFLKTVDGVSMMDMIKLSDIRADLFQGCEHFKSKKAQKICREFKAAMQRNGGTNEN